MYRLLLIYGTTFKQHFSQYIPFKINVQISRKAPKSTTMYTVAHNWVKYSCNSPTMNMPKKKLFRKGEITRLYNED